MSLYASFNGTLTTTIDEVESILTHTSWRYRGPHEIRAVGKSGLLRGVQAQQQKTVSSIQAIAKAAQDIAQAANQSTQLINDAIGGHVLIRREPGGTNEILIMDHPDPDQAVKIWRWNLGGLGYSDNVTGADNPAREYDVAMTMDGAINADFVRTGKLIADVVQIGAGTTFATGYDPSTKETPAGAQQKADAAEGAAKDYADKNVTHKVEIFSSGGLVFKNGQITTTLIARVYKGKEDVTDLIDANYFRWTRISDDTEGDEAWNATHYSGMKQVVITQDDVFVRATFNCTILNYLEEAS